MLEDEHTSCDWLVVGKKSCDPLEILLIFVEVDSSLLLSYI